MTAPEKIQIICQDGYALSGSFYKAQIPSTSHPILLCPATGITKRFYHSFATWLSAQGYAVLSFDFRGIGESLHGKIKDSDANIVQWGQLDLSAGIDHLLSLTKAEKVIVLGHSAGGQLLGVVPNYEKVAKVVAVAGSSGFVKGLKGRTKLLAPVMFNIIFPLARHTLGYGPTQAIGMGENLPKDVARQWATFCNNKGYILNALGQGLRQDQNFHHDIRCPITSIWASDDEIATAYTVNDFLRLYPNAPTKNIEIKPKDYQHKAIGHMLMFKTSHQNLWPVIEQECQI